MCVCARVHVCIWGIQDLKQNQYVAHWKSRGAYEAILRDGRTDEHMLSVADQVDVCLDGWILYVFGCDVYMYTLI